MKQMIELNNLDQMQEEYNKWKKPKESFRDYLLRKHNDNDWIVEWFDSVGIVSKGDFENHFKKKYIEDNFESLGESWFKGLSTQVDFGEVLNFLQDEFPEGVKK